MNIEKYVFALLFCFIIKVEKISTRRAQQLKADRQNFFVQKKSFENRNGNFAYFSKTPHRINYIAQVSTLRKWCKSVFHVSAGKVGWS